MTDSGIRRFRRLALWFSPNVIAVAGFFGAIRWLRPSTAVAEAMSAAMAIFVLGYTLYLGNRESRRLDEVQRAQTAFAHSTGWVWGGFATIVLLMVPSVMNWLVDRVDAVSFGSSYMTYHLPVRLAFFLGITLVMVMQTVAIVVASFVWQLRMGGFGEQS